MTIRTITCSCGATFKGDHEDLYSQVRGHVDRLRPGVHRPVSSAPKSSAAGASVRGAGSVAMAGSTRAA